MTTDAIAIRARLLRAKVWGDDLLVLRDAADLTQEELADALDVSARSVRNWEKGSTKPSAAHRRRLRALFDRLGLLER